MTKESYGIEVKEISMAKAKKIEAFCQRLDIASHRVLITKYDTDGQRLY